MGVHLSGLAGEMDFLLLPAAKGRGGVEAIGTSVSAQIQQTLARYSVAAGSAVEFFRDAAPVRCGQDAFDEVYQVRVTPERIAVCPIDTSLAKKILEWPNDATVPKEILAWRDPFGLHLSAHLPGPPNWSAIAHFLTIADELCARLPERISTAAPTKLGDHILSRYLES